MNSFNRPYACAAFAELLSLMPCFRQHSQQRPRALEGIRGCLVKLGRHECDEGIEPGEPDANIVQWLDGHRQAAVIGHLVDPAQAFAT
jgi:hypothetical protein